MTNINALTVKMTKQMARTFINRHVPPGLRSRIEDDVTSDAMLALVEADRRFDSDGHEEVPFKAYAASIVKWRMIDGLRVLLGRSDGGHPGGPPSHGKVVPLLDSCTDVEGDRPNSEDRIDRRVGGLDDGLAGEAEDRLAMTQFVQVITFHLRMHGTHNERYVFDHRIRGETLKQVAVGLGVTESRVCQIDRGLAWKLRRLKLECPR